VAIIFTKKFGRLDTIESGNAFDPFAVLAVRDGEIIGHVPRKISAACSLFLRHHGCITCQVTRWRQLSRDLPQHGLKIPCQLTFQGEKKYVEKLRKLFKISAAEDRPMVSVPALSATADSDNSTSSSYEGVIVISDDQDNAKRRKV